MLLYREVSWWYWVATAVLLLAGLAGWHGGFHAAIALSALQVLHFRLREGRLAAFPVQVRLAFTGLLLLAAWPPLGWLYWVPALGTTAQVLFGYCLLARGLSLLPWNRREPLSWRLLWRTLTAPPVRGSILQGLPATP
ncbi:hypothetical protein C1M51_04215 [Methylibium sp. Pch-M]|uniref:hypothetical protein n=1 Tax=Methylibium sp. Pch-M TaxID=2082386 RepID=UPI001010FEB8|nr:hypothetical protein [Methylibium sp. Pch-M]QAZ38695.1 hypothetical protein C1M51_04215 [Methylibium sp. Pch-M]